MAGTEAEQPEATETTPLTGSKKTARITLTQVVTGTIPAIDAEGDDDSHHCMDQDDPTEIVSCHAGGGSYMGRDNTSIFKERIEEHIETTDPQMHGWLSSVSGLAAQAVIIVVFISISVYEAVFKKKALKAATFDFTSIVIFQGVFSVIVSLLTAVSTGRFWELFNSDTPRKLALYFPVGCTFSATAYLQFVILEFLAVDVFKILEQGRLLVTAIISLLIFKRNQSLSGWSALVVITFAAVCYGQMSQLEKAVTAGGSTSQASKNFVLGFMLTIVFILLQCGASVYCELILKKDKHLPFFIQKFYLEVPGTLFGLLLAWKLDKLLVDEGLKKEGKVKFFVDGPFAGWDNHWVILCFVFFVMKSWGSGFLVKQMSSLVKQLCSVTSVGVLYFFGLVHLTCSHVDTFFCPAAFFSKLSLPMVMADFCVLFSVTSYTLAQRDKRRKVMYREKADKAMKDNESFKV